MKSLDCNQIKIFINLEIRREEDKYIKIILIFFKILKKIAATWHNYGFYTQLLLYSIWYDIDINIDIDDIYY